MNPRRRRPPRRKAFAPLFALIGLALAQPGFAQGTGSAPGGVMRGQWKSSPDAKEFDPVTFSYHREELGAGRISVQLGPEGPRYVGSYLRLTGSRPHSRIRVYYTYWVSDPFDDYRYGPAGAALNRTSITIEQFQARYAGSVVAKLIEPGGNGMRCVFDLDDPARGLAGGASGRCQVTDGTVIDLPRRRP